MFLCWNATVCLDCSLSFSSNPQLTILVAADGALKFPDVRNYGDLKAVVDRLNSIPTRQIQVLIDHCNDFFSDLQSIYYICPAIYLYILFLIGPVISGHSSFMDSSRWEGHSLRREAARGLSLSEAFVWWLGLLSRVLGGHQMFLVTRCMPVRCYGHPFIYKATHKTYNKNFSIEGITSEERLGVEHTVWYVNLVICLSDYDKYTQNDTLRLFKIYVVMCRSIQAFASCATRSTKKLCRIARLSWNIWILFANIVCIKSKHDM
jgi:hypothetical protein